MSPRSSNNRGTCFWSASISINPSLITLTDLCNTSNSLSRCCFAAPIKPIRLVSNFSLQHFSKDLNLIFCCCCCHKNHLHDRIHSQALICTMRGLLAPSFKAVAKLFTPQLLPRITRILRPVHRLVDLRHKTRTV